MITYTIGHNARVHHLTLQVSFSEQNCPIDIFLCFRSHGTLMTSQGSDTVTSIF